MSVLDEILAEADRPCGLREALAALEADETAEFTTLIYDPPKPNVAATAIARALARRGHSVAAATITKHRRGECPSCKR